MDFFRSRGTLLIAGFLISLGCMQFFFSKSCADAAKAEATTIGTVYGVAHNGEIFYGFKIDGVQHRGKSGSCRSALTSQTCDVGAKVLVYYVYTPALETRLQDYVDASREMLFTSILLTVSGLVLIVVHFVLKKTENDSDESDDTDETAPTEDPADLHIVPRE